VEHSYTIKGEYVTLCPLKAEKLEQMRNLRNRNCRFFVSQEKVTEDGQRRWYQKYLVRENDYMFSVVYQERWIGVASIYDVDRIKGRGEFGRLMIDRAVAGAGGLGLDATRTACRFACEQLKLRTVELEVYADNIPAQITYLKAGFLPTELLFDGKSRKMVRMEWTAEPVG